VGTSARGLSFRVVFDLADLFVVGLSLDLVGAYLLAKGLLASPSVFSIRSASFWGDNPHVVVGSAEDRVDALFGLGALLAGFALQALGYFLALAIASSDDHSACDGLVALGLGAAVAAMVLLVWRLTHDRVVLRTITEIARWEVTSSNDPPQRTSDPDAGRLASYAQAWRGGKRSGETAADYLRREFGIESVRISDPEDG